MCSNKRQVVLGGAGHVPCPNCLNGYPKNYFPSIQILTDAQVRSMIASAPDLGNSPAYSSQQKKKSYQNAY